MAQGLALLYSRCWNEHKPTHRSLITHTILHACYTYSVSYRIYMYEPCIVRLINVLPSGVTPTTTCKAKVSIRHDQLTTGSFTNTDYLDSKNRKSSLQTVHMPMFCLWPSAKETHDQQSMGHHRGAVTNIMMCDHQRDMSRPKIVVVSQLMRTYSLFCALPNRVR